MSLLILTGELERTFLVLREVVALRRLQLRDGESGEGTSADPAPQPAHVVAEAPRGLKGEKPKIFLKEFFSHIP